MLIRKAPPYQGQQDTCALTGARATTAVVAHQGVAMQPAARPRPAAQEKQAMGGPRGSECRISKPSLTMSGLSSPHEPAGVSCGTSTEECKQQIGLVPDTGVPRDVGRSVAPRLLCSGLGHARSSRRSPVLNFFVLVKGVTNGGATSAMLWLFRSGRGYAMCLLRNRVASPPGHPRGWE